MFLRGLSIEIAPTTIIDLKMQASMNQYSDLVDFSVAESRPTMKSNGKEIAKNFKIHDPYLATSLDLATSKVDTEGLSLNPDYAVYIELFSV